MASIAQLDEAAFPLHREGASQRIKARGAVIEADTHAFRNRKTAAPEDSAEHGAVIGCGPAPVLPGVFVVLISKVPMLPAIEVREGWQQLGHRRLPHELQRLLAVVVEHALAIHEMLPVDVVGLVERWQLWRKGGGFWCFDDGRGSLEIVEVPKPDRVVHRQARCVGLARFHDATGETHIVDDAVAADVSLHQAAKG